MHRAYRPVKPAQNKLLQRRWDNNYYEEHRRKVIEARPYVDTRPPQTYMHLHLKLKKLQLEEERLSTIERDNRILLGKMSNIMKAKGRVDNQNNYESKSLNRDQRVRELIRVSHENQDILKRITTRKPKYDHNEWEKDWETNQQYMDQISAYPKDWWKKSDEDPDGAQRSSRRGETTNRSSRTNDDDDDSPEDTARQNKPKKKRIEEEDDEDEDMSSSEDDANKSKARKREDGKSEKKGKEEEKEEWRIEDRKRIDKFWIGGKTKKYVVVSARK